MSLFARRPPQGEKYAGQPQREPQTLRRQPRHPVDPPAPQRPAQPLVSMDEEILEKLRQTVVPSSRVEYSKPEVLPDDGGWIRYDQDLPPDDSSLILFTCESDRPINGSECIRNTSARISVEVGYAATVRGHIVEDCKAFGASCLRFRYWRLIAVPEEYHTAFHVPTFCINPYRKGVK